MTAPLPGDLRALVRGLIKEIIPQLDLLARPQRVAITNDDELAGFVRHVLGLADDPLMGALLRSGQLRFQLGSGDASAGTAASAPGTPNGQVIEIQRGVLTERIVSRAVTEGAQLVLGRKVVITPLAREQIRKASVEVVRRS